jgi:hypothetical protein
MSPNIPQSQSLSSELVEETTVITDNLSQTEEILQDNNSNSLTKSDDKNKDTADRNSSSSSKQSNKGFFSWNNQHPDFLKIREEMISQPLITKDANSLTKSDDKNNNTAGLNSSSSSKQSNKGFFSWNNQHPNFIKIREEMRTQPLISEDANSSSSKDSFQKFVKIIDEMRSQPLLTKDPYSEYVYTNKYLQEYENNTVINAYSSKELVVEHLENPSITNFYEPIKNTIEENIIVSLEPSGKKMCELDEYSKHFTGYKINLEEYNPNYILNMLYVIDISYIFKDNSSNYKSLCEVYYGSTNDTLYKINNYLRKMCVRNKGIDNSLLSELSSINNLVNLLINFFNNVESYIKENRDKCISYDYVLENEEIRLQNMLKKYKIEFGSILLHNIFLLSMNVQFNEIEKQVFKEIISLIFTGYFTRTEKDKYNTLNYCLINLIKQDKSIIWILKVIQNYSVSIHENDKKTLLKHYPKNKEFIKILDKIPIDNSNSPLYLNTIKSIFSNEEVIEENLPAEAVTGDPEEEIEDSLSEESQINSEQNNKDIETSNNSVSENSELFLSINNINLTINSKFNNINIVKKENGKISITVN